jgi:hypothetical protein
MSAILAPRKNFHDLLGQHFYKECVKGRPEGGKAAFLRLAMEKIAGRCNAAARSLMNCR